jgi:hypothetical protein
MKFLLAISAGVAVTMVSFITLMHYTESKTITVRYDCRMLIGGWHPDVPIAVQEQCRKLKGN